MTDFTAAVGVGMAVRIPLTPDQATRGFDRLVAIGIAARYDGATSSTRLQELLNSHHFTGGLALVPQATPTNNSEAAPSGFSSRIRMPTRPRRSSAEQR